MKIVPCEVNLIQVMGDENTIVDAARVSFAKRAKDYTPEQNQRLIKYLATHNHWTPFSHCVATFQIKAPIFVARQLMRHTVGLSVNETSRRYVDEEPEYFLPQAWRSRPENGMKQGSGVNEIKIVKHLDIGINEYWESPIDCSAFNHVEACDAFYKDLINAGVAPEQARMVLPQNMMTEWWWTGSLAAWARVFNLRLDPHTQQETRDVVQSMYDALLPSFPNALTALMKG